MGIESWSSLDTDEDVIAKILANHGPISVAIDASGGGMGWLIPWLKTYKKGVANPKKCHEDALDHAVLLVGIGEDGYFRLLRGAGKCGVNTCASTAIVKPSMVV